MTGFPAVAKAADRAMREPGPDPVDPNGPIEECPLLLQEMDSFLDDPITTFYGVGSEMSGLVVRQHVARHHCQGYGRP